jgi:hypothetical protein
MINWILAAVGLAIYFLVRYKARRNKNKFNLKFWLKDNWPEVVISLLATFAFMIIMTDENAELDFTEMLANVPFVKSLPADKLVSLAVGYLNSWLVYTIFKVKK